MALICFRLFRNNLGNLQDFFGQMGYRPPPPPLAKNFPYAYGVLSGECDQISVGQFYVFYERLLFMQGCRYDYKLPGKFS